MNKIQNIQGITNIKITPSVCCYCPLGNDWYNMLIEIEFNVGLYFPDYCDIRKYLNENIQGKSLIIEDVISKIYQYMLNYEPKQLTVRGIVKEIESHPPVIVEKTSKKK